MIALYIILGILLFLFLLLLIPARLEIAFREEFSLTLRYLFFKFPLLPGKEKPEEPEEKREEEKKSGGGLDRLKAILKQEGFFGFLQALFELAKLAADTSKRVLSKVKVRRFDLYLCLAGKEDAAAAAILYGQLSGPVYGVCGFLFGLTGCKKKAVVMDLDYQAEENKVDFSARISLRPLVLLKEGLSLLGKAFPYLRRLLGAGAVKKNSEERVSRLRKQGTEQ